MNLNDKKFLLIEDDENIFELIKAMLETYNTEIVFKQDGQSGYKEALNEDYDLILLDIMLPKMDGWEVCKQLKENEINTPIIMLTAKVEETDKVLGLEMGADDYVTKPFSPRELRARIKAVLRRFENAQNVKTDNKENKYAFPKINLVINYQGKSVVYNGKSINLAPKEFELFTFLARNKGTAFTRKELIEEVWGEDHSKEIRTIDEHIKRIRRKLKDHGMEQTPFQTVWGTGYKFEIEGTSYEA
mgnify:FL=1